MDKCWSGMICVPVILDETKAMDYRTFYTSSSSIFLWSYEVDLLQDGSVAAKGTWEKEYPVHPRPGDSQRLEMGQPRAQLTF